MTPTSAGRILIVDDDALSRRLLGRAAESDGYEVGEAPDGARALELLAAGPDVDVVLLDVEMPALDGEATLARIKGDDALRHLPVIMVSGVEDLETVVRCIEAGATDYLPKPFDAAILRARLKTSLAEKRLRDLEREYLEEVGHVISAAVALEADEYDPATLTAVAAREDALGLLARTFEKMASEVRAREDRLRERVRELTIEIDEQRQARKVAEITDTDYFKGLRSQADELRRIVAKPDDDGGGGGG